VSSQGLSKVLLSTFSGVLTAVGPVAGVCMLACVLANVAQVRPRFNAKALRPDFKKLKSAIRSKPE